VNKHEDASGSNNSSSDLPVTGQIGNASSGEFLISPSLIASIEYMVGNDNEDDIVETIDVESSWGRNASSYQIDSLSSEYVGDGKEKEEGDSENTKSATL